MTAKELIEYLQKLPPGTPILKDAHSSLLHEAEPVMDRAHQSGNGWWVGKSELFDIDVVIMR